MKWLPIEQAPQNTNGRHDFPSKWLWLRFNYQMLIHPTSIGCLIPFKSVTYNLMMINTYVLANVKRSGGQLPYYRYYRESFRTKVIIWFYVITFRVYEWLPWTLPRRVYRRTTLMHEKSKELMRKQFNRQ